MIKKGLLLFAAAICLAFVPVSCEEPVPTPPQEDVENPDEGKEDEAPVKLKACKCDVPANGNNIFETKPEWTVTVQNPNEVAVKVEIKITVSTDKGAATDTVVDSVEVAAS